MSSPLRNLQRKVLRGKFGWEASEQPVFEEGGKLKTLHFTKGWRIVNVSRLAAERVMANLLNHYFRPRPKKAPKVWRKPAPVPKGVVTRQQRRYAARKGLAIPD